MNTRRLLTTFATCLAFTACGGGSSSDNPDAAETTAPDAAAGDNLTVVTPDVVIQPGQEITYCYYFDMPNTDEVAVHKWASTMTPGSHHLILYFTDSSVAAGTLVENCNTGISDEWTYSSQTPVNSAEMPDGVAMKVAGSQRAFMQMHYLNASDEPLTAHSVLTAEVVAAGTAYVPAAAYITYSQGFSIAANSPGSVSHTCTVPAGAQFFSLSTHSHQWSTDVTVMDGANMVLATDNWEHPEVKTWDQPYYTFASGKLSYECNYFNGSNVPVNEGSSAQTNEMCMAVGYFFPAPTGSKLCVNDFLIN